MATFIALAVLLSVAVLGGVLWPLWRDSRTLVLGGIAALGLATFALYRVTGTPASIEQAASEAPMSLDAAIAELRTELKRNPNQPEGWQLLGKTLASQGKMAESSEAFAQAVKLLPDDPNLLVEAAQARLYASSERKLDSQAIAWVKHALTQQPGHQRAIWLLGISQRQNGQPAEAAKTWEPLLSQVDPATAATLRKQIDAARAEAGLSPLPAAAEPATRTAGANALTVKVALDPDFASRVRLRGDTTVFVIARIPGGPPMPVAVEKHSLQDLPLSLTLDDGDSPMPTQKLSALKEVELIARLSASGDPMRQEGDLESKPVRVSLPAAAPVELVLGGANP
ncbi:cytochrome C biogenesis protein [Pseudoxanthomonas sp. CF125]|uniref:tetratricopeptide repeat protein n=1 Tax=Pseudoxanthomonas sp. CF125 TaxID=1855303 RepID=UPI00088D46BB|nr:cytochrome C biogenesis protein [Pseudoxanthomonas sp. CF125]SDQ37524.1 cytochrome c-type biogenesis protein CcmH [Pseudoxanthomonas sp. CF125]